MNSRSAAALESGTTSHFSQSFEICISVIERIKVSWNELLLQQSRRIASTRRQRMETLSVQPGLHSERSFKYPPAIY